MTSTSSYPTPKTGEYAGSLSGTERDDTQHAQWCSGWDRTKAWAAGKGATPVGDHEPAATVRGRNDFLRGPYVE